MANAKKHASKILINEIISNPLAMRLLNKSAPSEFVEIVCEAADLIDFDIEELDIPYICGKIVQDLMEGTICGTEH